MYVCILQQLLEFVAPRVGTGEVRLLLLLTKADKLSRREAQAALAQTQQALGAYATDQADIGVTLFSALTREGLEDVALALRQWVEQP
jgi:GTP-binding protein